MGTAVGRCVLLGGGEILDYAVVAENIQPGDVVICADSGYDHCARLGVTPHLLVGDFDSVQAALPAGIPRIPLPAEKDHTDTTHAIEEAMARGCRKMLLAGVLGRRLDHTLAALQNLAWLCRQGVDACLTDGRTDIFALADGGQKTLHPREGYYFSLLSLSDCCEGVTITGAKYLLQDYTLTNDLPRAVSNEFLQTPVRISLRKGTLAILLVPMD